MINGKKYSWEDISVMLPHGEAVDIQGIEYSDGKEIEAVYGKGSNPTGYGAGNYSAEGKLTLLKEEHDKFIAYAKRQKTSLYKLPPFPITVSYANEDQPTKTDVLKSCKINKVSHSGSQGDKQSKVEYEINILGGIVRDGLEPN
ncbi:hypothetical protein [Desulfotruncus alcoholivorax]|uniref:hypothetical protein n=1 Tax=Desulfotruncus alcoholivorax TaxID=265477 RepID=UPI000409F095|nr:hypothetical protein [Desulfotruncus alcoholivorax]